MLTDPLVEKLQGIYKKEKTKEEILDNTIKDDEFYIDELLFFLELERDGHRILTDGDVLKLCVATSAIIHEVDRLDLYKNSSNTRKISNARRIAAWTAYNITGLPKYKLSLLYGKNWSYCSTAFRDILDKPEKYFEGIVRVNTLVGKVINRWKTLISKK